MKTTRTKAIVLRRTNYGESDRILLLLTPQYGKVSVIARGVRREKSKLAGGIELFARSDITYTTGKSDLGILTGARVEQFYQGVLGDYARLQFGYEAIKHISKAADAIDEAAFFELLDQTFAALDDVELDVRLIQAWFWLQLAILLGVGVNLSTDGQGMKLVEGARYQFDENSAVFGFQENGRFTSDHIKLLRILSAHPPQVAAQVQGFAAWIDDCLWLAQRAVAH